MQLDNGPHNLTAILGDAEHLVVKGQRTATIHITVADGFRGKGTLNPACSNLATGIGEVRVTFPNAGGEVQGTIEAACASQTHSGACTWLDEVFDRIDGNFDASSRHLSGRTSGTTERRLRAGNRKSCGQDQESRVLPGRLAADLQNDTVAGTVNGAHFTLAKDETVELATPPPVPSTPAPVVNAATCAVVSAAT